MSARVEATGVDMAIDALTNLSRNALRKTLRQSLRASAKRTADKAKQRINKRSGDLARSIKVRAGKNNPDSVTVLVIAEGAVQGDVHYGAKVELGHKHGKRPGKADTDTRKTVPAHPFLRPSFDETRSQVIDEANRAIDELIEQTNE